MEPTRVDKTRSVADSRLRTFLLRLLLGRAISVALLVVAAYAFQRLFRWPNLIRGIQVMAVATVFATLLYSAAIRYSRSYRAQLYLQMVGDTILVSWLVHVTGSLQSPFFALYLIVIAVVARVTTKSGIYALTGLISFSYLFVVSRHESVLSQGGYATAGTYLFAIVATAFLSSKLSEQETRTDANLAIANRKLNDIRAFSERVIDSISSGLVTIDLSHQILSFNRAAEEIVGYRAADLVGKSLSVLFPSISQQLEDQKGPLLEGHPLSRLNLECTTADGRLIQLGLSVSPLTTVSGEITGFVLPFQDLTDVMRLERDVRRHDRLAALGRVAAAIAHEIRNPLASMRGAVQVLGSDSKLSDEESQLMNIVLRESDRIDRIISDFLMYARPRQPELEEVNLNDLLEETLTLLRHSTEFDIDKFQLAAEPCRGAAMVMADPGQLRQVLWNLARNAIKAMPDGGEFRISINRVSDGSKIEIKFYDTGIGMTEEQIERIFEPFSSFAGGTGLGMSIVYHIINEHGGTIDVSSEVGRGTTISIRLTACPEVRDFEIVYTASATA